jgi:hypothetical protein
MSTNLLTDLVNVFSQPATSLPQAVPSSPASTGLLGSLLGTPTVNTNVSISQTTMVFIGGALLLVLAMVFGVFKVKKNRK